MTLIHLTEQPSPVTKTIEYYDNNAAQFCGGTITADMNECRDRFTAYLKPGQKILDAGCGSGRDIIAFRKAGFEADGFDASAEICRIASENTGLEIRQQRFEDLEGTAEYDGIWACASLLHVRRQDLSDVLKKLRRLLKKGGVLYVSFKYGDGETERGGRYFNNLSEEKLAKILQSAGFEIKEIFVTQDVRADRPGEKWVNAIAGVDPNADI